MTKRILLPIAILFSVLAGASPAHAGQGTEQLLGAYNFLLEGAPSLPQLENGRT
jgi:hypothetical protein